MGPAERCGQLLVICTSCASDSDPCLLHCRIPPPFFFSGDSVPVLGVKSFLVDYREYIMNLSNLVIVHVKQSNAVFCWLNFKKIFLTLLIKIVYAYPAKYKHVDQSKKNIAYKLEQKCSAIYFPFCCQKNLRNLMIPNECGIWWAS